MLEPPSQVEGKLRRDDTNGGHRLAPGKQFAKSVLLPLLLTASSSEWMKAGSSSLQMGGWGPEAPRDLCKAVGQVGMGWIWPSWGLSLLEPLRSHL